MRFDELIDAGRLVGKRRRPAEEKAAPSSSLGWKVVRLAARDRELRKKDGGDLKSKQKKAFCEKLEILKDGVKGTAKGLFSSKRTIEDYNHYRTQGRSGRFEAGTRDRAVSVATVAAYDVLQKALDKSGKIKIEKGDLGENILLDGPPATATNKDGGGGLFVGAKIKVGTAILELTEANNPCYRFNTQTWASAAKTLWGKTAPDGNVEKWFKSPKCPLNHEINPGTRGWLAKVLEEGETTKGDEVKLVLGEEDEEKNEEKMEAGAADSPPPSKKQKTTTVQGTNLKQAQYLKSPEIRKVSPGAG
jgi:MOSC domain-containing protein YiiM